MTFKKDYINFVLYTVMRGGQDFRHNERIKRIVEKIRATDDVMKITYLVGKTAGLELLFKYLLYISDKIDKSQITVFNLKDNFDHDVHNLVKVFGKIVEYKSESVNKKIESIEIPDEKTEEEKPDEKIKEKDTIKIDTTGSDEIVTTEEILDSAEEEIPEDENAPALTLIENTGDGKTEAEVFELSEINEDIETTVTDETEEQKQDLKSESEQEEISEEETADKEEIVIEDESENEPVDDVFELENLEEEVVTANWTEETSNAEDKVLEDSGESENVPNIEIEVRKPLRDYEETGEIVKEESVTNEAYYKFESKFFEEVKILEKLFLTVEKECNSAAGAKLSGKYLQCLTEIIEITSELSNLSHQLSFDLIADIFLTMNLYFTKAISSPEIIVSERIRLLGSSLSLVNSLIKGEDYLNYDVIVDKIEVLKNELMRPAEKSKEIEGVVEKQEITIEDVLTLEEQQVEAGNVSGQELLQDELQEGLIEQPASRETHRIKQADLDSVNFKMRYLIKEFEKSFQSIGSMKGEYKKFDALDKVDELNNALRLIAKISGGVKMKDVLKLAEVAYVFLKYLKDYRMNLLDPEIQQIIKYIIFTFKMLLTDRKPEDFNVLVQYLNNPVKIFTDS
jgi:hypothetical protein